jgi:hypothetical protein
MIIESKRQLYACLANVSDTCHNSALGAATASLVPNYTNFFSA